MSACFSFSGYEAGAHMSEETINATRSTPIGLIATCVVGAVVGFAYLLALLFATPDIDLILSIDQPVQPGAPSA